MNPKVDFFFENPGRWQKEFVKLRSILLDCGLNEELKWGQACYTSGKKNIVLIHGFKEYCALLFFKGALLKDAASILVQQTENVQSARQVRFTNLREITKITPVLKQYVYEALAIEQAGLKVKLKAASEYKIPEEFQVSLKKIKGLSSAFYKLTPGRQRAYLFYSPRLNKQRPGKHA